MTTTALRSYTLPMQQDVALFHDVFEHPNNIASPGPLPLDRIDLRVSLIREEGVDELAQAILDRNIIGIVDALVDNVYVTLGALVEMGADAGDTLRVENLHEHTNPVESLDIAATESLSVTRVLLVMLEKAFRTQNAEMAIELLHSIALRALLSLVNAGIDPHPFFDEVHRSNMSKLGADGKPIKSRGWELDGAPLNKTLRGPNYFEPNIAGVYERLYA